MITFTKEQLATLRKIAQQATQDEWRAFISPGTDTYAVHTPEDERCGDIINWPGFDGRKNAKNNAEFIAAFNPKVVLALLDVLDASLDVKPVASCIVEDGCMCVDGFSEYVGHTLPDGMHELYAAPLVPVVPDEMYWQDAPVEGSSKAAAYATGWNACREAMLQGKGE